MCVSMCVCLCVRTRMCVLCVCVVYMYVCDACEEYFMFWCINLSFHMVVDKFKGADKCAKDHVPLCCPSAVGHPNCYIAQSYKKSMERELRV